MWYIGNVENWFDEIIESIQRKRLSIEDSKFMLVFCSSMDFEIVEFFRNYKEQISSYSGENFHILTPTVYGNNTIPDNEWRKLRNEFNEIGIKITNEPTAIFFNIKRDMKNKCIPTILGGYGINYINNRNFNNLIRNSIDMCLENSNNLVFELERVFSSPNIAKHVNLDKSSIMKLISRKVDMPTLFISFSSKDREFARKLGDELINNGIKVWIDEDEILVGDSIGQKIKEGINNADFLIFIISKNSLESKYMKFELHSFIDKCSTKNILPLVLDESVDYISKTFREINDLRYLDFSNDMNWKNNLEEIIKRIL